MRRWCITLLLGIGATATLAAADNTPIAQTTQGAVVGYYADGHAVFKGIPYAQPPVAGRRWQKPAPADRWTTARPAQALGPACPQPREVSPQSEDCLYLNVWTPGVDSGTRPVMVWVHGGGFRFGSGDIDGHVFARQDVVTVAFNYRLGPLGFFAHPAVPEPSANFGLLDMVAALQWVRDNIGSFGGDPDNVTIFGVSAGGMAVNMLMVTPGAAGLFRQAIAQSGYGTWPLPRSRFAAPGEARGWDLQTLPGAEQISSRLIDRITSKPQHLDHLLELDADALAESPIGFHLPIVDGTTLAAEPAVLASAGKYHPVSLMTGGNSYEGTVMPGSGIRLSDLQAAYAGQLADIKRLYADDFGIDTNLAWQRLFGDNRYLLAAHVLSSATRRRGSATYLYYVDYVPARFQGQWHGTPHGADAGFLFAGHTSDDPQTRALASRMVAHWASFARNGDPATPAHGWPVSTGDQAYWKVFGARDSIEKDLLADKLAFLQAHYQQRLAPVD